MYALVHWEDLYVSLISLENVKHPRKPLQEYAEGDYILATYGKRPFKARISEINEDRSVLKAKLADNYEIKHKYMDIGNTLTTDKPYSGLKETSSKASQGSPAGSSKKERKRKQVQDSPSNTKNVVARKQTKKLEDIAAELEMTELQKTVAMGVDSPPPSMLKKHETMERKTVAMGVDSPPPSMLKKHDTMERKTVAMGIDSPPPSMLKNHETMETSNLMDFVSHSMHILNNGFKETCSSSSPVKCKTTQLQRTVALGVDPARGQPSNYPMMSENMNNLNDDGMLEKRILTLEEKMDSLQSTLSQLWGWTYQLNERVPSNPGALHCSLPNLCENKPQQERTFKGYTKGQLSNMTTGVAEYGKAAKLLFRCLYSSEETRGRSIAGGSQTPGSRKGLEDLSKLSVIYEIMAEKYGVTPVQVREKLRDIMKPSRNK